MGTPSGIPVVLPNVNATPGLILIPITVGNTTNQSIISYDLNVDFNPAIIQPAVPPFDTAGTLSSAASITPNTNNSGHFIISAFQGLPLTGSGTLIFLRFNVVGTLGQSTTLVFADYTDPTSVFHPGFAFNEGDPQAATTNGSVTVSTGATATNTPTASPTPTPGVSGVVTYGNAIGSPATRYVNSVNVQSTSGSPSMSALTDTQGSYLLTGFGAGSYIITPSREEDTSGAITAFDAALIAQHTLGFQPLLTGNPLTVADVSGNGFVNSYDAGFIASFVNASPFPHGLTSGWRFLPASRSYPSISGQISGQNYTALLMGDVSGSWGIPGANPDGGRQRQSAVMGNANVDLPNMKAASGKEIVVPVHVQGAANKGVISCQFVLRYDPAVIQPVGDTVEVLGTVGRGLTTKANAIEPGVLRVVMYGPIQIDQNGVLFNLRFTTVGAIGTVSPLIWERIMFNEGEPQVVAADGKIEIGGSW